MMRRWALPTRYTLFLTRYTLRHNKARIMKGLIVNDIQMILYLSQGDAVIL